ncbi:MAG: hypothetical protein HQK79_19610 [Desulfobacterales bacterium]|nr:hypothetical protein [Desulfobacterales bacterium]
MTKNSNNIQYSSFFYIFIRLYRLLFGPVILVFLLIAIALNKLSSGIIPSLIFWIIVISLIEFRYIDIRYLNGLTKDCEPATMLHWKNYALYLPVCSALIWMSSLVICYILNN